MKAKYLRKNLNNTKKALRELCYDYKVKLNWETDPKQPKIYIAITKRIPHYKCIKIIVLPEDKIAYGKYKPGMVVYNVERQLSKWLSEIYEEYCL